MDIKIEAPGHSNQAQLQEFYTATLNKSYGGYDFVKSVDVKVKKLKDAIYHVSLAIKPEKGTMLYASDEHQNEHTALKESIRKMHVQIEKYKSVHYHGHHKAVVPSISDKTENDLDLDFDS